MPDRRQVVVQCGSCGGTGLYEGFAEPRGEPVICLTCGGTGAEIISFTPYVGRRHRSGVKKVRRSRGRSIAIGVGGQEGSEMTYQEFLDQIPEASRQ